MMMMMMIKIIIIIMIRCLHFCKAKQKKLFVAMPFGASEQRDKSHIAVGL